MRRVCFVPRVRPDRLEEHRERHREAWPEMPDEGVVALREVFHLD
ncbi:L-rhamnose mutarotase [Microbispora sp. CA-102843]